VKEGTWGIIERKMVWQRDVEEMKKREERKMNGVDEGGRQQLGSLRTQFFFFFLGGGGEEKKKGGRGKK